MVDRTAKYDGMALMTEHMDHQNFTITNIDNLEYIPNTAGGYAQLKIDAEGGNTPLWKSIEYTATTQQTGGYYTNMMTSGQSEGTVAWNAGAGTVTGTTTYTNVLQTLQANTSSATTTYFNSYAVSQSTSTTVTPRVGSYCLKQVPTTISSDSYTAVGTNASGSMNNFTAGYSYTVTGWIYIPNTATLTPAHATRGLRIVAFTKTDSGDWVEYNTSTVLTNSGSYVVGWNKVQLQFAVPSDATSVMLRLYSGHTAAANITYWNELQVTRTWNAMDWVAGQSTGTTPAVSVSEDYAQVGTKSAKVYCQGQRDGEGQYVQVTTSASTDYSAQVYVHAPAGVKYKMLVADSDGTSLYDTGTLDGTGEWVQLSGSFTTGSASTYVRMIVRFTLVGTLSFSNPPQKGSLYCDSAMINNGPIYPWITGETTKNWAPDLDFHTELYGINEAGNIEFIGEILDSTELPVSTTAQTRTTMFDLLGSACRTKFIKLSKTGTTGKVTLNIPMRTNYYDHFNLLIDGYTGWTRYKVVAVVGGSGTPYTSQMQEVTIPYDSEMASDYKDIRVTDSTDTTLIPFCILRKSSENSVTIGIQMPTGPASGVTQTYHVWYKNPNVTATTAVNPNTCYTYWDDWEDGLLTGRTSPYRAWTNNTGAAMKIGTGTFYGSYSPQITSPSTAARSSNTIADTNTSYSVDYDYKVRTRGGGSAAPWHSFYLRYVSSSEFVAVDFYYNTDVSKQYCKLNVNGTTIDARKVGSRWISGDTAKIHIADTGSHVYVYVNDYIVLSTDYTSTSVVTKKGFGTYSSGDVAAFDNLRISPMIQQQAIAGVGSELTGKYGGTDSPSETPSDTLVADTEKVTFTTPTITDSSVGYIDYQEKGKGKLLSDTMTITDAMIINQGYNSLDAYKSLILKWVVSGEDYKVSIDRVIARYEV